MRNLTCLLFPFCFLLSGILSGCSQTEDPAIDILHIEGVSWACNVTTSCGWFGSSTETEGQNGLALAASDGDLLYMTSDELQFYYRYNVRDGQNLVLAFDTLNAVKVYLNEALQYMEITSPSSLKAFASLSDPEMRQLSTLNIDGVLEKDLIPLLKQYESRIKGLSLVLETGAPFQDLRGLLEICRPEFLVLHHASPLPEPGDHNSLEGLELLWIDAGLPMLSKSVLCCGDLESLILSSWDPRPGEMLALSHLSELQNLSVAESNLSSLQNIEFPGSLRSLNLIDCDTLLDISQLSDLPEIYRLSLTACDRVQHAAIWQNLASLRWISLPGNITQKEFEELCGSLEQLEVAELYGCEGIRDLLPLGKMERLHTLSLNLEQNQLRGLDSLDQLKLLILTEEVFDDNPFLINDLRTSLPDTRIVPGSGICLGSGWLLLLLPILLFFRFIFRRNLSRGDS